MPIIAGAIFSKKNYTGIACNYVVLVISFSSAI